MKRIDIIRSYGYLPQVNIPEQAVSWKIIVTHKVDEKTIQSHALLYANTKKEAEELGGQVFQGTCIARRR